MANIYHAGNQIGDAIPGHAIKNGSDVTMTQRNNLQFVGATVTDDNVNDKTVVTIDTSGDIGSRVTVTTSEAALDGATVTLTDGTTTLTGQIVSGEAVFANITFTGTYTITVTNGVDTLVKQLSAPYFGNYTIDFEIFNAYINITTASANLYNQTITVYKDGVAVGTTAFNGAGSATYAASETGTYTFSVTISAGTFTSDPVAVTEETTYATTITSIFAVTVTLYSAAADTVSYTDINGAQTATTDNTGALANVSIEVDSGSPSITFTSSVAKDPDNLSNAYTKTITITAGMTELYVMPDDALYWWGYISGIETMSTANGWTPPASHSFINPTYNTTNIFIEVNATYKQRGVGTSEAQTGEFAIISAGGNWTLDAYYLAFSTTSDKSGETTETKTTQEISKDTISASNQYLSVFAASAGNVHHRGGTLYAIYKEA